MAAATVILDACVLYPAGSFRQGQSLPIIVVWRSIGRYERQKGCCKWGSVSQVKGGEPVQWLADRVPENGAAPCAELHNLFKNQSANVGVGARALAWHGARVVSSRRETTRHRRRVFVANQGLTSKGVCGVCVKRPT